MALFALSKTIPEGMNFCEKLTGEDLLEFHQQVVLGFTSEEEVWSTMVPNDLPMDLGGTGVGQPGGIGPAGLSTGGGGLDSSGLLATPIDDPAPYTNPCKFLLFIFESTSQFKINSVHSAPIY